HPASWGWPQLQRFNARHVFAQTHSALLQKVKIGDIQFETEFKEAFGLGMSMLDYYFQWAPKQDRYWRPIFIEIEFQVPIPGLEGEAVYQGRIDLVVEVFDAEGNSLGYY